MPSYSISGITSKVSISLIFNLTIECKTENNEKSFDLQKHTITQLLQWPCSGRPPPWAMVLLREKWSEPPANMAHWDPSGRPGTPLGLPLRSLWVSCSCGNVNGSLEKEVWSEWWFFICFFILWVFSSILHHSYTWVNVSLSSFNNIKLMIWRQNISTMAQTVLKMEYSIYCLVVSKRGELFLLIDSKFLFHF